LKGVTAAENSGVTLVRVDLLIGYTENSYIVLSKGTQLNLKLNFDNKELCYDHYTFFD
jgi:hypothetical protein